MQAALVSAPLGSTPPQGGSSRLRRGTSPGVMAFRNPADEVQPSSSASRGSTSLLESGSWRSPLGRTISSNGTDVRSPLSHTRSIPKAAGFVKVEGFSEPSSTTNNNNAANNAANNNTATLSTGSPTGTTTSGLPRTPSLLSRQLSHDNLGAMPRSSPPTHASLAHLEASYGASPTVEPKPLPRGPPSIPRRHPAPSPDAILAALQSRYPVFMEPLAVRAFHIAFHAHAHDRNAPEATVGEAPFSRGANAAAVLAELGADEVAIAGALLHDVLDSTMLVESQLRSMLMNDEALELVKRVSHLGYVAQKYRSSINGGAAASATSRAANVPNPAAAQLVDLMVANGSPRALLVRLAVSLQDSRWLDSRGSVLGGNSPPAAAAAREARRLRAAAEALDVWAPLANRLGVWSLKAELEDRAFRALHPAEYHELRDRLEAAQEPTQLVGLMDRLRSQLQAAGVEYLDLSGRPKHLWGVWTKMKTKGYSATERVRDVRGLRVIVKTREDCYRALRAVETAFRLAGAPKNYIKDPKANGYQSLHAVADPGDGHLVEIQIRTDKMHYLAEYGAEAAHWKYKEVSSLHAADSTTSAAAAADGGGGGGGSFVGSHRGSANANNNIANFGGTAARQANWAKYKVSQTVVVDKKVRPSGSPSEDQSLASIMAAMETALGKSTPSSNTVDGADGDNNNNSNEEATTTNKGRSFEEYIAASGQRPAPPGEAARALVAVVAGGNFAVADLEPGTTIAELLSRCGAITSLSYRSTVATSSSSSPAREVFAMPLVIVNRQEEPDAYTTLQPGDIVELYPSEPTAPARHNNNNNNSNALGRLGNNTNTSNVKLPVGGSGVGVSTKSPMRGNMVPVGPLRRKLSGAL